MLSWRVGEPSRREGLRDLSPGEGGQEVAIQLLGLIFDLLNEERGFLIC
ncbi:MAG: hypothetical protein ACOYKZ_06440 [Chlamydiia bacterium]